MKSESRHWWKGQGGLVLACLTGAALLVAQGAAAQNRVYRFIDPRGVVHFSDVPHDRRYRDVEVAEKRIARRAPPENGGYDRLIRVTATTYGVEPALVKAVIAAESNFQPRAVSRVGAQGLMQLMPGTAEVLGVDDAMRAEQNVDGGVRYLREMLDRYGDLERALAAYNAGPTAVDRYRGIPPYAETRAYVARVLNYYYGYHDEFRQWTAIPSASRKLGQRK